MQVFAMGIKDTICVILYENIPILELCGILFGVLGRKVSILARFKDENEKKTDTK